MTLMTLPFRIKCFRFCIEHFKLFDSRGRLLRLGRTSFEIRVSMVVLKTFSHAAL